jgi:hypothetical protein
MRIGEILTRTPLEEMSYSRKKAEAVITGLEKPINDHLLKLLVVESGEQEHWIAELLEWLDEVAEIRLKPDHRPGSKAFYYRIIFDEPFGGAETENVARRGRRIARQGYAVRQDADLDALADDLRSFHEGFAHACSKGVSTEQIEAMIRSFLKLRGRGL